MFNNNKKKSEKQLADRNKILQLEFDRILSLFKTHSYIAILDPVGSPLERFTAQYSIDGLHLINKTIEAKNEHRVEFSFPNGYPADAPLCKPLSPIYHPSFTTEAIDISKYWSPNATLKDLIVHIGKMICFQEYEVTDTIHNEAAKWASRNKDMLPLSKVDLSYKQTEIPSPKAALIKAILATPPPAQKPLTEKNGVEANEIIITEAGNHNDADQGDGRKTATLVFVPDEIASKDTAPIDTKKFDAIKKPPLTITEKQLPATTPEPAKNANSKKPDSIDTTEPLEDEKPFLKQKVLLQFSFCQFCGSKVTKNARFCSQCGSTLSQTKQSSTIRRMFLGLMIAIPFFILGAGSGMVFFAKILAPHAEAIATSHSEFTPKETISRIVKQTKPAEPKPVVAEVKNTPTPLKQSLPAETTVTTMPKPEKKAKLTEEQKKEIVVKNLSTAKMYYNIASYDDAIKRYKEVLKVDPTNFEASVGIDNSEEARDKTPTKSPNPDVSNE